MIELESAGRGMYTLTESAKDRKLECSEVKAAVNAGDLSCNNPEKEAKFCVCCALLLFDRKTYQQGLFQGARDFPGCDKCYQACGPVMKYVEEKL